MIVLKNIEQALVIERPFDKVLRIVDNKWAIVMSAYDNGTFAEPSLCYLDNGVIYFYPANVSELGAYYKYVMQYVRDKRYVRNITKAYLIVKEIKSADTPRD